MKKGSVLLVVIIVTLAVIGGILFWTKKTPLQKQNPQLEKEQVTNLTENQAIEKIKNLPEVKDYLNRVPRAIVDTQTPDEKSYSVHVYEIKDGHTATFNWYIIEKTTGKITKQFEFEQETSEEFENFTDQTSGISIFYPPDWQVKKDTQIFENGDLVTFQKTGPTQKGQTDFYDGARLTIGKPFSQSSDVQSWAKNYYGQEAFYSTEKFNVTDFVKVETCDQVNCQTYYHAKKNNKIYSIFVFAQGEEKIKYQVLLKQTLNTLTF